MMTKLELVEELKKLVPLVKAENEAKDNWDKSLFMAWNKPLNELAAKYGELPHFGNEENDWKKDITYIGIGDVRVEVN